MSRMPVLFIGHGSPLNAVVTNDYTRALAGLAQALPTPKAVLVVSAHWLSRGTRVLTAEAPRTIHDFRGFPPELYAVDYPAPGAPAIARRVEELVGAAPDASWGLDHGTWSVLRHMWPMADVPVLQLSLDVGLSLEAHYELARKLAPLRDEGVLILGSGNVTHNLGDFDRAEDAPARPWAVRFDALVREALVSGRHGALTTPAPDQQALWATAHPSIDHFLPLLYAAGASAAGDVVSFPYEGMQNASLSMRSVRFSSPS